MADSKRDISGIWNAPAYRYSRYMQPNREHMEANRLVCYFPDTDVSEFYTQIRTRIQQAALEKKWNTIMITSPGPGTGKTVTAINLALNFAKTCDNTVLLVDCDFRNQMISKMMGIYSERGLADIIINGFSLQSVIIWPGIEKLTLVSGGKPIQGSAELISSPQMAALITDMKKRYKDRFVFFDLPEALSKADALAFSPLVDCILIVVEEGKTTHKEIEETLKMFPKEKILGFVYNKKSN